MKNYKWFITFFILIMCNVAKAQLPFGDPAWILQTGLSDEFDSTALRTYKWNNAYWGGTSPSIANGAEINYASNLLFNDSTLKIKADTLVPNVIKAWGTFPDYKYGDSLQPLTYAYQGGVIQSKISNYKFGYVEISAKYPSKKFPLWPAFWLFGASCTPGSKYVNESDIAENGAGNSYQGNVIGNAYWWSDTSCSYNHVIHGGWNVSVLPSSDSLSGGFHKFALEWDPHHMIYYFDDKPISEVYDINGVGIPQNPVMLILNFCVDPWWSYLPSDWNGKAYNFNINNHGNRTPTSWPQYFEIDYVHYYKLGTDCNTDLTNLCTPSGYDRKVKRSITTDNTCTPTFNPSSAATSYSLRATDDVLIDVGTTINPSGTGFFEIEIMACPQ